MRYIYDVIAGEIGNTGGHGPMKTPHAVTIHHSAVVRNGSENGKEIAKAYCSYHGGKMPYHFLITRKESDPIFCTQYVTQFTYHNANYTANRDCIAICVDGNFQTQNPSATQLKKLKQLLDDIANNWFSKNGWVAWETSINPKNNSKVLNYQGVSVKTLHYHNEVAQPGHGTACCGANLIPKVVEYRNKGGNVSWGSTPEPTPDPCQKVRDQLASEKKSHAVTAANLKKSNEAKAKCQKKVAELEQTIERCKTTIQEKDTKITSQRAVINKLEEEKKILEKNLKKYERIAKMIEWFRELFGKIISIFRRNKNGQQRIG